MRFAVLLFLLASLSGCLTNPGVLQNQSPASLAPLTDQRAWIVGSLTTAPDSLGRASAALVLKTRSSLELQDSTDNSYTLSFDWKYSGASNAVFWNTNKEKNTDDSPAPYDSLFLMEIVPGEYYLADISVFASPYTTHALNDYYIPVEFAPGTVTYLGAFTMETLTSGNITTAQIAVEERFEFDVSELRHMYPQLEGKEVINGSLPITYISPFVVRY
ncbi:hypothetical protein BTA51_05785 [Hahella sp. CCB-MM4]|uniref:hypothetical protein n=1 Tax=Hahella sp. (strain CCB-MM4) TaxID=1926491 RepID=UPI000B9B7721|nr:hypothetical protein [Hahella sp. CCB-MM4]OZG74510.1 hypothetical protein BTA51_05785 [Hahella sp. CCB-MM4]